jgi:hypothetical protein
MASIENEPKRFNQEVSVTNTSSITRRSVLKAAAAPLVIPLGRQFLSAAESKPNILYIMADDLGYADLSCYGRRDFKTPNIDRIAAGGMKFTQAYANSSVCSATRTALITGRYQYRLPVGLEEPLGVRDVGFPPNHPTLPSLLQASGYGTMLSANGILETCLIMARKKADMIISLDCGGEA